MRLLTLSFALLFIFNFSLQSQNVKIYTGPKKIDRIEGSETYSYYESGIMQVKHGKYSFSGKSDNGVEKINLIITGNYKDGVVDGAWTCDLTQNLSGDVNSIKVIGNYKNGLPHGKWTTNEKINSLFVKNGYINTQANFKDGLIVGKYVYNSGTQGNNVFSNNKILNLTDEGYIQDKDNIDGIGYTDKYSYKNEGLDTSIMVRITKDLVIEAPKYEYLGFSFKFKDEDKNNTTFYFNPYCSEENPLIAIAGSLDRQYIMKDWEYHYNQNAWKKHEDFYRKKGFVKKADRIHYLSQLSKVNLYTSSARYDSAFILIDKLPETDTLVQQIRKRIGYKRAIAVSENCIKDFTYKDGDIALKYVKDELKNRPEDKELKSYYGLITGQFEYSKKKGLENMASGHTDEALKSFKIALNIVPDDKECLVIVEKSNKAETTIDSLSVQYKAKRTEIEAKIKEIEIYQKIAPEVLDYYSKEIYGDIFNYERVMKIRDLACSKFLNLLSNRDKKIEKQLKSANFLTDYLTILGLEKKD
jgi:hypothetical protein